MAKTPLTWDAIADFGVERFFQLLFAARRGRYNEATEKFGDITQTWLLKLCNPSGTPIGQLYVRWMEMRTHEIEYGLALQKDNLQTVREAFTQVSNDPGNTPHED
jgi:hypothetical protein